MGFFGDKKKEELSERQRYIQSILEKRNKTGIKEIATNIKNYQYTPDNEFHSSDYSTFKKDAEKRDKKNFFESMCAFSEKILKLNLTGESAERLQKDITFTGLNCTPSGVLSFSILALVVLLLTNGLIIALLKALIALPTIFILFFLGLAPGISYYIYNYPKFYSSILRMTMGRDLVLAILYIIVYMKSTANLEGAVRYAAENVSGKLAKDLKLLLWNVEIGKFATVDDALLDYVGMWKEYNKEFVEAIELVMESMIDPSQERRNNLLDKAIDIVLEGTGERMKKYARGLEMPIEVIHGMGILLPVMGMVVFPLVTIFLKDEITHLDIYLVMGYNIFLPIIVFVFIYNTLLKRPPTFSSVDLSSDSSDYKDKLKIGFGKKAIYINYIYIPMAVAIIGFLFLGFLWSNYSVIFAGFEESTAKLMITLGIVLFIAFVIALYYYLASFQKMALREKIIEMETEFGEALFALGNRLSGGMPLESGLQAAYNDIKNLKMAELFAVSINNMTRMNMTFKQSLFDKDYGAMKKYPSKLIRTIMNVLASSVDRGTRAAAMSMVTISRYLRNLKMTQEKIEDLLSSSLSSMRFNAYVLVPTISGIIVGISKLVLTLLTKISGVFANLEEDLSASDAAGSLGSMNPGDIIGFQNAIPTYVIQLVIGIYVIEILILLAIFMTRVEYGNDKIKERNTIWKLLLTGTVLYVIVFLIALLLFNPIIENISSSFA